MDLLDLAKNLLQEKIHKKSKRNNKPFIILNGALLDANKYELELFGKKKKMGQFHMVLLKKLIKALF